MLTFEMIIVFLGLIGMVTVLVLDKMRPGMILFSVTVLFLCFGILTPKEMLEGFSNKGMITVALLFLISEGVRRIIEKSRNKRNSGQHTCLRLHDRCLLLRQKFLYQLSQRSRLPDLLNPWFVVKRN